MSCYVVNRETIDSLVRLALEGPTDAAPAEYQGPGYPMAGGWDFSFWNGSDRVYARPETADDIGRMLWTENVRSVAYRYPDDGPNDRPGPVDFTDAEAEAYTYGTAEAAPSAGNVYSLSTLARTGSWVTVAGSALSTAEAAKLLDGYEYQTCEHPEWEDSAAFRFVTTMRCALLAALPGYREAQWT